MDQNGPNCTIHHISIRGRRNAEILMHVRNALERADMSHHIQQTPSTSAESSHKSDDVCDSSSKADDATDKDEQKPNDN